jgi:hypothetical protein
MPNIETHYNLVAFLEYKIMKGLERFSSPNTLYEHVRHVARCSQMVDTLTPEWISDNNLIGLEVFATQCYDYDWWKHPEIVDPRCVIWTAFHFPYSLDFGLQSPSHYRQNQDALFLRNGLGNAVERGVIWHRYFDGMATHRFFLGRRSSLNEYEGTTNFAERFFRRNIIPSIGHAAYGSEIDRIDCKKWRAPNKATVRNKDLWIFPIMLVWPYPAEFVPILEDCNSEDTRLKMIAELLPFELPPYAPLPPTACSEFSKTAYRIVFRMV